jgi:hypothetical protein
MVLDLTKPYKALCSEDKAYRIELMAYDEDHNQDPL